MRYLVLLIIFICMVSYCYRSGKERSDATNKAMLNQVVIKGEVVDVKTSRNHSFGILLLRVDSTNLKEFIDSGLKEGIYPYKIKNGKAELYVTIPDGIQKGDIVTVDSDKLRAFYSYIKTTEHYEGYLGIVTDPMNIEYVKQNTVFK